MRNPAALLLTSALLASAVAAHASGKDGGAPDERCAASAAALPAPSVAAQAVYSTEAPGRLSPAVIQALNAPAEGAWHPKAPRKQAFAAAIKAAQISATSCANVRALAAERGELLNEAAARAKAAATPLVGPGLFVHRVSLAALSADHTQAIVAVVSSSNHLAGGSTLVLLEKDGETWREVARRVLTLG